MLKFNSAVFWRLGTKSSLRKYSSSTITILKAEKVDVTSNVADKTANTKNVNEALDNSKAGLLASAFASLNNDDPLPEKKPSAKSVKLGNLQKIDVLIKQAIDVNSILSIAETPVVSRRHALKIVSVLSEWSSINKVKLMDFEKDPRFLRLCRILARTPNTETVGFMTRPDDLGTVLGITGDDEAARLINNLTLPQMVKVMQALAQKGRRSTPLLRALANNIADIAEPIDLKKSADLLFCMSSLNFPDPVLMDRICNDAINQIKHNSKLDKTSVVTSIVTSLGLIRYRHEPALSATCDWIADNRAKCRPQDIASTIVTLAALDFVPPSGEVLLQSAIDIKESDLVKSSTYLDLVFSLLILEKATPEQLESTLRPDFIEKLLAIGEIPITVRRKLIAIDAYISLSQPTYSGPRLPEDIAVGVPVVYTKEKQLYVQTIMDTFKNLISSGNFLKRDCNSQMGFLYDAEFVVDAKCHPVALSQAAGKEKNVFHIAVLGLDYHDLCRKTPEPLGNFKLYTRLLELKGFKVLQIPYSDFNPRDKLITRVQYIEKRLKEIVGIKSS